MHILLIEDEHFELEYTLDNLKRAFPKAQIVTFGSVEDFLMKSTEFDSRVCVLITEHFLPLMKMGKNEEEMSARYNELKSRFPWVAENWTHQQAGERLIRHIRRTNKDLPIVIYTHSDEYHIAKDVRSDPKVRYCYKTLKIQSLVELIRSFGIA
jgi:hypothetical protein